MPGSDRPNVLKVAQSVPGAWPTIPALTRLMSSQATFEPVSAKTQPVSGHTTCQIPDIENSCSRDSSRKTPPRWEAPDFPRQRPAHCPLTLGNVGGSPTPGNHTAETGLAGWGARIRTWEWRNQNPQEAFDMQRLSGLMLHLCLMRQGVLAVPPPILAMIPSAPFVRR